MNTKELAINKAGKRQTVKHRHNSLINFLVVLAETYINKYQYYIIA